MSLLWDGVDFMSEQWAAETYAALEANDVAPQDYVREGE
jgi:hypothetical protein